MCIDVEKSLTRVGHMVASFHPLSGIFNDISIMQEFPLVTFPREWFDYKMVTNLVPNVMMS